jgi:protein O-mannosyl-transferase
MKMIATNLKDKPSFKRVDLFICIIIIMATLCVYSQVKKYDFVGFDDNEYVYENAHVKTGLTLKNILWAFTAFHSNNWHPLTWISHMMDCQVFGLNPGLHHLMNLFFHIVNSLLLYFVFKQMTGEQWKCGFMAAVFALHPLHVESVAWISERKDVLTAFFWLLAMWSYFRYSKRPCLATYAWVFIFFLLGLLSKPMIITLPFVLMLMDYWPLDRFDNQAIAGFNIRKKLFLLVLEKIPLLILVPVSSLLTFYAQKQGGIVKSLDIFPLNVRIANAIVSYALYIIKIIYPVKMAFLYPHHGMPSWLNIGAALILISTICYLSIRYYKKYPYVIVGWLWYLGTLVPVIGIVQVGMQSMADRYTYIPSIGLLLIVAWGVPEALAKWRYKEIWLAAAVFTVIAISGVIAWKQTGYWKNSLSMLEHTIRVTSKNYIALDTLGVVLLRHGRTDEAINYHLQAQKIYPNNPYSHFSLGVSYFVQGKIRESIDQYLEAIKIEPEYYQAHTNLGAAYFTLGNTEKAVTHYLNAITINPEYVEAYINLGLAYDKLGRFDDAVKQCKQAFRVDPDNINAHFLLANILEKIGNIDEAICHYSEIAKINPGLLDVQYRLGVALYRQGRTAEAIQHYLEVLKKNPDSAETHNSLGTALYKQGRIDDAIGQYLQALDNKPDYAEAHNNLGGAYLCKGDANAAIASFQQALRINPGYTNARNNLQQVLMVRQQNH